jgi:uncharacterized membrane protein (DUF485 family)
LAELPELCYFSLAMTTSPDPTPPEHNDFIHSEDFLHALMARQLKLSIACAAAFMLVLVGLPLLNYFAPEMMAQRVAGYPLTWLILGVLFFPFVWVIARIFITRSMALEEAEVKLAEQGNAQRKA